jgi:hypothetical protein
MGWGSEEVCRKQRAEEGRRLVPSCNPVFTAT